MSFVRHPRRRPIVMATVTAALFVAALLAVYAYSAGAPGGAAIDSTVTGNYLEVAVEADSAPGPAALVHGKDGTVTRSTIRWWWTDDGRFRIEIHNEDSLLGRYQVVLLPDGDQVVNYNRVSGTYQRHPMPDLPPGELYRPPAFVHIGPLPANTATIDEFVEQVAARQGAQPDHLGSRELLGQTVEVFAVGPAGSTATTQGSPTGTPAQFEWYGVRRLAIDPATRLILLDEADGEGVGQSHRAEGAMLELDARFDQALFRFDPPAFVQEFEPDPQAECRVASTSTPAGRLPAIPGFLHPDHVPDRWVAENHSVMGQDARCPDGRAWTLLRINTNDGYLFFDQRRRAANDVPEWLRTNTPVDVAGHQGYRLTEHGVEYLVWARDGILALLESDTAPFEDLLRMAESARLR